MPSGELADSLRPMWRPGFWERFASYVLISLDLCLQGIALCLVIDLRYAWIELRQNGFGLLFLGRFSC